MKKRPLIITGVILAFVIAYLSYRHATREDAAPYRFATVERGDIEAVVSATGVLNAVTSVQVGTQVSGQIAAIFADFNDEVKKGQLIARIDPTLQQQAIADAQAGLDRSRAELARTREEYERNKGLFEGKVLTEVEFSTAKYAYEVAQANVKSSQVALDRARQNLAYTSIYAPIDGVVVERNVDVGQTVASSYSTPQLFLIAKDLSQMQILANVDESDIGADQGRTDRALLRAGLSEPEFSGRGQPGATAVEDNRERRQLHGGRCRWRIQDGKLLPGMTATVEFLTGAAKNVLTAPNAALRFRPPQEALGEARKRTGSGRRARPASIARQRQRNQRARGQRKAGERRHALVSRRQGKLTSAARPHRHHRRPADRGCRAAS